MPIDRIDQAMRRFGMSYGPCEWMDRIGIDSIAELVKVLQPVFSGRHRVRIGFSLMHDKGWLGNRSEDGFYRPGLRKKKPNHEVVALWRANKPGRDRAKMPGLSLADSLLWIQRRLVTLTVLSDSLSRRADRGRRGRSRLCDVLNGWVSHRGGPIGYARTLGRTH